MKKLVVLLGAVIAFTGCATIHQDEIGVKRRFGKLKQQVYEPGLVGVNPFTTRIIRLPARTENLEVKLPLPSKEGLNVQCEISILYRIEPSKTFEILSKSGEQYVDDILLPVFRSAAADVSAQFMAKDMHTAQRAKIETAVREKMLEYMGDRGIIIEAVLMKSVQLPSGLARSIEQKLEAEQDAQRMEFVIKQEELEARRKVIEATASRDAQLILQEGLTPLIIQMRQIEALQQLATSPNSKVIITNGKTLFTVDGEQ